MKLIASLFAAAALVSAAASASAGTLILSGDATTAFRFNTAVQTGNASLAGNIAFSQALLGGGNAVSIFGGPGVPAYTTQLVEGFSGIGATVSAFSTPITAEALAGADLFVAFFPNRAFTNDEGSAILNYLTGGGTVFLAGEATTNPFGQPLGAQQNARINDLLGLLGSSMRLETGSFDIGDQFATLADGEIVADPLTAGIRSFGYGLTTTVAGGNALFLTNDLRPFVSYETFDAAAAIPEPATWALMIAGFGLVGFAARKRPVAASA